MLASAMAAMRQLAADDAPGATHLAGKHSESGMAEENGNTSAPSEPPFDRDPASMSALLGECGAQSPRARVIEWNWIIELGALHEAMRAGLAATGAVYVRQDAGTKAKMLALMDRQLAPYRNGDVVSVPSRAVLATGRV